MVEIGSEGVGQRGDEVTSGKDEHRVVKGLLVIILVRILFAERLLFEDLHVNAADGFIV